MVISGLEKELGAIYEAKRIENDELVYYIPVKTDSIIFIQEDVCE